MGLREDLAELCPSTVQLKKVTRRDFHQQATLGPPTSYAARVVGKTQRLSTGDQEVWLSGTVVVLEMTGAAPGDVVVLPGGREERIIAADLINDDEGPVGERWTY